MCDKGKVLVLIGPRGCIVKRSCSFTPMGDLWFDMLLLVLLLLLILLLLLAFLLDIFFEVAVNLARRWSLGAGIGLWRARIFVVSSTVCDDLVHFGVQIPFFAEVRGLHRCKARSYASHRAADSFKLQVRDILISLCAHLRGRAEVEVRVRKLRRQPSLGTMPLFSWFVDRLRRLQRWLPGQTAGHVA
jgi:hypothetical protein